MKRLTDEYGICTDCNGIAFCKTDCMKKKLYDKLKQYEDAEEQSSGNNMTLEELKAEAEKHGYMLTKKQPYTSFPTCSCNKRKGLPRYTTVGGYFYECPICKKRSKPARLVRDAKANWNDGILVN